MPNISIIPLHELENNQEADLFALLSEKEAMKTKEGKPYIRVMFRDAKREVRFPVWSDSPVYQEFKDLTPGTFCKLRAQYRIGNFGPQLDVRRIRPVTDEDIKDGFDSLMLRPKSPLPLDGMFEELQAIATKQIGKGKLLNLLTRIFKEHRTSIQTCTAARRHHHCYVGGLLEHTLSVAKIALALVEHYHAMYPDRKHEISKPLVVAGAILHDIGKIREFEPEVGSLRHSLEGNLLGHPLLGRDIVREAAFAVELDEELRLRLEHIVVSHGHYPDWGNAKPPMSLEAMLVHHADSCDALTGCFWNVFSQDQGDQPLTSNKNVVGYALLKPSGKS